MKRRLALLVLAAISLPGGALAEGESPWVAGDDVEPLPPSVAPDGTPPTQSPRTPVNEPPLPKDPAWVAEGEPDQPDEDFRFSTTMNSGASDLARRALCLQARRRTCPTATGKRKEWATDRTQAHTIRIKPYDSATTQTARPREREREEAPAAQQDINLHADSASSVTSSAASEGLGAHLGTPRSDTVRRALARRVSDAACASHAGLSESTPTTRRRARLNQTPPGERDATRKYQVQVSQ